MTKEKKINIISFVVYIIALFVDEYFKFKYFITPIVIALDFILMKIYEKKTGVRLYRTGRNKWLDLMLLILLIVLLIMVGLFIYMIFSV